MEGDKLLFERVQSRISPDFWAELGDLKLQRLRLEEGPLPVEASYTAASAGAPGLLAFDALPRAAGEEACLAPAPRAGAYPAAGDLYCLNTAERVAGGGGFDRAGAAAAAAAAAWAAVASGAAEADPSLLCRCVLLTHVDLKTYKHTYWAAWPAVPPPAPFRAAAPPAPAAERLGGAAAAAAAAACDAHAAAHRGAPAWLVHPGTGETAPLAGWRGRLDAAGGGGGWALAFPDPSARPEHPGWPLRNLLLLAAARWRLPAVRVLCLRTQHGRFCAAASTVVDVALPEVPPGYAPPLGGAPGWEPAGADARGAPRERPAVVDLSSMFDPRQQAAAAVDLNLQLMRWRAAPALDPAAVSGARCLLVGAGTLGCAAARALLGWGVRSLTFVDRGAVAHSNPARQSLFTYDDAVARAPKAAAAAAAVRRVAPGVDARAAALDVPSPGRPLAAGAAEGAARAAVAALDDLVAAHDVVFLLTDTRESRWLPALLAAARGRLAVTAALGFDSFLVMRHGFPGGGSGGDAAPDSAGAEPGAGHALSCYFCADVVAPLDSAANRSLDQECTVSRPGLAGVAGALAAELAAATLAHPARGGAAAAGSPAAAAEEAAADADAGAPAPPLGQPPHMVRGALGVFSQTVMTGAAFSRCTACSAAVVAAYRERGADFVVEALRDPAALERLTGLDALQAAGEAMAAGLGGGEGKEAVVGEGGGEDGDEEWQEL